MDWSDEVHQSRYAASLVEAHDEIHLKKQNSPVPISHAAKSGGPMQSLLLLGGLGALVVIKTVPNAKQHVHEYITKFIHDHPTLWSPIETLFSGDNRNRGRNLGGSNQQPKAPKGAREAASKAAKAAAAAAAARASAPAKQATPLVKETPSSETKTTPPSSSSAAPSPAQTPEQTATVSTQKAAPSSTKKKSNKKK